MNEKHNTKERNPNTFTAEWMARYGKIVIGNTAENNWWCMAARGGVCS